MTLRGTVIGAAGLGLLITGCAAPAQQVASPPVPAESTSPSPTAEPAVGKWFPIGDWELKITNVNQDAAAEVAEASPFGQLGAEPEGNLVLIDYKARYLGPAPRANVWVGGPTMKILGSDGIVYSSLRFQPPALYESWPTEARAGTVLKWQWVIEAPPEALGEGASVLVIDYPYEVEIPI